ncbi:MAG: hypothetical protein JJ896_01825 [Rhodothermales bacterium]|nr:hypothetical protein [Rhodothermales bacterium]MBO6778366.1 hypothetical protein [Rhodothermales bacterium]
MAEGYDGEQSAPLDEGLDEFLCEYVDGAMDPVVLKAFEEYLRANPQVAAHAQCLCQAKRLLSQSVACPHGTSELQFRLKEAIAREQLGSPAPFGSLGSAAWLTSAVGLMLIMGMLFGTAVVQYNTPASGPEIVAEREIVPSDAHAAVPARLNVSTVRYVRGGAQLPSLQESPLMTPLFAGPLVQPAVATP